MNKVINIEIAKQVFWIEECGYDVLHNYLEKLKLQLKNEECGDEIFFDIELRLAELLFELTKGKDRALTKPQLIQVIEQIGFVDSEEQETSTTRKIYLDVQNKVMAGVCSGLSLRLSIPAFILRLSFLALAFAFGFGILLYLILWFSFDRIDGRTSVLAAQGKVVTAKGLSSSTEVQLSRFLKLQRIVFLPFSLLGVLISVIANSFITKRSTYIFLFKNVSLLIAVFILIVISAMIVEFNKDQIFPFWMQWILSLSVVYIVVLLSTIFVREYYLVKPLLKVNKSFKRGAIVPLSIITISIIFLMSEMVDEKEVLIESDHVLHSNSFTIDVSGFERDNEKAREVDIFLRSKLINDNKVKVSIRYFTNGRGDIALDENIQAIDFKYSVNENKLSLNNYFELKRDAFNRGQRLKVYVDLPSNITLISSHSLKVNSLDESIEYKLLSQHGGKEQYLTANRYFHEDNAINHQRVSNNERYILTAKFCQMFFVQSQWECARNIEKPVQNNHKFNQAFIDEYKEVNDIRTVLNPNKVMELKELSYINDRTSFLLKKYPNIEPLNQYIKHLLSVKNKFSLTVIPPD